jgi:hypothetical protein
MIPINKLAFQSNQNLENSVQLRNKDSTQSQISIRR